MIVTGKAGKTRKMEMRADATRILGPAGKNS